MVQNIESMIGGARPRTEKKLNRLLNCPVSYECNGEYNESGVCGTSKLGLFGYWGEEDLEGTSLNFKMYLFIFQKNNILNDHIILQSHLKEKCNPPPLHPGVLTFYFFYFL